MFEEASEGELIPLSLNMIYVATRCVQWKRGMYCVIIKHSEICHDDSGAKVYLISAYTAACSSALK